MFFSHFFHVTIVFGSFVITPGPLLFSRLTRRVGSRSRPYIRKVLLMSYLFNGLCKKGLFMPHTAKQTNGSPPGLTFAHTATEKKRIIHHHGEGRKKVQHFLFLRFFLLNGKIPSSLSLRFTVFPPPLQRNKRWRRR